MGRKLKPIKNDHDDFSGHTIEDVLCYATLIAVKHFDISKHDYFLDEARNYYELQPDGCYSCPFINQCAAQYINR
jgi:hypothetical protein